MDIDKIKERIQKLLAMANDASSPNEAAIAASRVQKLMAKYNLEMVDVIAEEIQDEENVVRAESTCRFKRTPAYIQWIYVAISNAFSCESRREEKIIDGIEREVSVFFGYKTDVDIATSMCDYICDQLEQMAKRVKIPEEYQVSGMSRRYMADWRKGAAREICRRIHSFYGDEEQNYQEPITSDGQTLVSLKKDMIAKKFGHFSYGVTRSYRYTHDGQQAGRAAGQSISISKDIERKKAALPHLA